MPNDCLSLYIIIQERRLLHILAYCLVLFLAAAPTQAAPQAKHGSRSKVAPPAVHAREKTAPDALKNDISSFRIFYVWPHKKSLASVVVFMHLSSWDEVSDASGSFQKQTPQGQVLVKWHNEKVTLDASNNDVYGRGISSEFAVITAYTLIIDSPKALSVQLKTQQFSLYAMYLNGSLISKKAYFSGLSGEPDSDGPFDSQYRGDQRFNYTFPGGHNVIILQAPGWRAE